MSRDERVRRRKRERRRRANRIYQVAAILFVLALIVAVVANLVKKDDTFSASENRILTERPKLGLQEVASGEYMSQFESYVSDQFILRDAWIQLKLQLDKMVGKKESNGVYLGKDGYLMEKLDQPNEEYEKKNLKAIGDFAERHKDQKVYMSLAPNAAYILKERMPKNAPVRDQAEDLKVIQRQVGDKLNFIDLRKTMEEHASEPIYYKTDHHWTSLGAKYAFEEVAKVLDITPADYKAYTVSTTFSGTLASKSGYHGQKDTIEVYEPGDVENDYVVFYADDQRKTTSIFERANLKEKDQYTVFFGGNHTRVDIESPNAQNRCLLMFKDSYANSFVQFLTPYFRKIILIDPRYYYDDVEQLIDGEGVTDILFLYNLNTFLTDTSLADVLTSGEDSQNTGGSGDLAEEGSSENGDLSQTGDSEGEDTTQAGEEEDAEDSQTEGSEEGDGAQAEDSEGEDNTQAGSSEEGDSAQAEDQEEDSSQ